MIEAEWLSIAGLSAVVIYCAAQAVRDFRTRHYGWAVAAALGAIVLATIPVKSHVVQVDIPAPR